MKLRVNGKVWDLEFHKEPCVQDDKCLGYCERPDKKNKKIVIKESLRGDRKSTRLELQSHSDLVCRLLLEKKKKKQTNTKKKKKINNKKINK